MSSCAENVELDVPVLDAITQDGFLAHIAEREAVDNFIKDRVAEYAAITNQHFDRQYIESWTFDGKSGLISMSWEEPCGRGCCTNWEGISMPAAYLWRTDWEAVVREELSAKEEAKKNQERREAEERVEAKRKRDLAELARLKREYENENKPDG